MPYGPILNEGKILTFISNVLEGRATQEVNECRYRISPVIREFDLYQVPTVSSGGG